MFFHFPNPHCHGIRHSSIAMFKLHLLLLFVSLFLLLVPAPAQEDTTERLDEASAIKYKIVAMVSVLISGIIGVYIPICSQNFFRRLSSNNDVFLAFAAGVILSVGFVHVLSGAFETLTSPFLPENPWSRFPFTGLVAMAAVIATLMVDRGLTAYYSKAEYHSRSGRLEEDGDVENGDESHGDGGEETHSTTLRHRIVSKVLELGIVTHSRIIGVAVGTCEDPRVLRSLLVAITFLQLFDGMSLGGCIAQAKFKKRTMILMGLLFSLTSPSGIAIGIGISHIYDESNPMSLLIEGISSASAAGILIYLGLVHLLPLDFLNPSLQNNPKLQLLAILFLLLGAAFMSLLAIWV